MEKKITSGKAIMLVIKVCTCGLGNIKRSQKNANFVIKKLQNWK